MDGSGIIRFTRYLDHLEQLNAANQTVTSLHIASYLATNLMTPHKDSTIQMKEIYPSIPKIEHLKLNTIGTFRRLLEGESHLAKMSIPYLLLLHHESLEDLNSYVNKEERPNRGEKFGLLHKKFQDKHSQKFSEVLVQTLEIITAMRNILVHNGGVIREDLVVAVMKAGEETKLRWLKYAKKELHTLLNEDKLVFDLNLTILTFATCRSLLREANLMFSSCVSRERWLEILKEDLLREHPKIQNLPNALRKSSGFARKNYAPLKFTSREIEKILN